MTAHLLEPLTRPELDELLRVAEKAYTVGHIALANCPLDAARVAEAAAVAQDALNMWQDALDESIWRMWHGEKLTDAELRA